MKSIIAIAVLFCCPFMVHAQVKLTQGNVAEITFKKQPKVLSFATDDQYYFIFKSAEGYDITYNLAVADKQGNLEYPGELRFNVGASNNSYEINTFHAFGSKLYALVENRDKKAGQNRLALKEIVNGSISTEGKDVGWMAFEKMMKPGTWYSAVSPDRKQMAIIAQAPFTKGEANHFDYYLLDENLNVQQKGKFDLQHDKELRFHSFHTSNTGDFYFVTEDFDKSYRYPVIYKAKAGSKETAVIPATLPDAAAKNLSYTVSVNPAGELVVAGYYQQKAAVVFDDVQAKGSWYLNTAAPADIKLNAFDKPVTNLEARGIVFNGATWYLVGEQLKAEKEKQTMQQNLNFEENYFYKHNDIVVTAFEAGNRKFELTLNKSDAVRNNNHALFPAFGIIDGKLAIVYNDQLNKYVENTSYSSYRLPVLFYINNDGLMEAPQRFDKEFDIPRHTSPLFTQYFNNSINGRLVILARDVNGTGMRAVVFHP